MNAILFGLKALGIIDMLLGMGIDASPFISETKATLQAAADAGVDITDEQILALDAKRHDIEAQIQANVDK